MFELGPGGGHDPVIPVQRVPIYVSMNDVLPAVLCYRQISLFK